MPSRADRKPAVSVETFPAREDYPFREIPLREGMTLEDLMDTLRVPSNTEAVTVNDAYVRPDYRLRDGDRVRIIAFMWGG